MHFWGVNSILHQKQAFLDNELAEFWQLLESFARYHPCHLILLLFLPPRGDLVEHTPHMNCCGFFPYTFNTSPFWISALEPHPTWGWELLSLLCNADKAVANEPNALPSFSQCQDKHSRSWERGEELPGSLCCVVFRG